MSTTRFPLDPSLTPTEPSTSSTRSSRRESRRGSFTRPTWVPSRVGHRTTPVHSRRLTNETDASPVSPLDVDFRRSSPATHTRQTRSIAPGFCAFLGLLVHTSARESLHAYTVSVECSVVLGRKDHSGRLGLVRKLELLVMRRVVSSARRPVGSSARRLRCWVTRTDSSSPLDRPRLLRDHRPDPCPRRTTNATISPVPARRDRSARNGLLRRRRLRRLSTLARRK